MVVVVGPGAAGAVAGGREAAGVAVAGVVAAGPASGRGAGRGGAVVRHTEARQDGQAQEQDHTDDPVDGGDARHARQSSAPDAPGERAGATGAPGRTWWPGGAGRPRRLAAVDGVDERLGAAVGGGAPDPDSTGC